MKSLYALLLHLFPRKYRAEYGAELRAVFNSSFEEAKRIGRIEVVKVLLRELIGLPVAVIYEHLRERRKTKMINRFGSYFDFSYGSWKEYFTALLPFLFVGGIWPLIDVLVRLKVLPGPGPMANGIRLSLLGLFFILFLMGLTQGMPRWSLPYLGFGLSLVSVYFFSGILGILVFMPFPKLYDRMEFFGDIFYDGALWFGLLISILLLVVMTRYSPAFRRLRNDWTLPCFIVYGATPFAVVLTFDEYANDEPFMLLIFLVLAMGAWFYLRDGNERTRFWALFGALALSMFIAAAGKAILVPTQNWPIHIDAALAKSEAKHTIIMWGWLALGMLIPLVFKFLPQSDDWSPLSLTVR